ncbi:hypothetical protein SEA_PABST_42 [Microbacterium phage Pabst]|nr:hypothetical protein SEA_PABST_42 [Microbacterium phage Pabst]
MVRRISSSSDEKSGRGGRTGGGRSFGPPAKNNNGPLRRTTNSVLAPPSSTTSGSVNPAPGGGSGGGNPGGGSGGGGGGGGGVSDAENAFRKAGKDRTRGENQATQSILDALLASINGFTTGRDTQLKNADDSLNRTLEGIISNYALATADYEDSALANNEDFDAKTNANVANRARERMSLLQQTASQGAGETDQLRAQIQAFLNASANQLEVNTANADTERSILSQIANSNSQAEAQRRSAWAQYQEARGGAMNDFYKNYADTMTNAQRTVAQNSNVDSDSSEGFVADTKGYNLTEEASRYAGQTYREEKASDDWVKNFPGRRVGQKGRAASASRAGTTTISAPKAAEGSTLRGRG